jgi:hypothetical protein
MAEVAAVYDLTPVPRTAADIMPDQHDQTRPAPSAHAKWLTASVTDDATTVIAAGFAEATRRDPDHHRPWIALVDGNTPTRSNASTPKPATITSPCPS